MEKPLLAVLCTEFGLLDVVRGFPIEFSSVNTGESNFFGLTSYFITAIGFLLTIIIALYGCVCCRKGKGFKEFSNSSGSLSNTRTEGFVNPTSNAELTIFPPAGVNSNQICRFEPLPEIKPHVPNLRPAAFSCGERDISSQDWFSEPHSNFPRNQLKYFEEYGRGWFGRVVEGEAQNITPKEKLTKVIVKILHEDATATDQMYFLHEVKFYKDLNHPNILRLLGRCLETEPFLIILECYPNGDLKTFLSQNLASARALVEQGATLKMCSNITSGLQFMHKNKFIHTDLAARNCLVGPDLTVKIGDYGNSIENFKSDYYCAGSVALPIRWCAPETLKCTDVTIETREVTPPANIWSLGIIFWEICEFCKLPYSELNDDQVIVRVLGDKNYILDKPAMFCLYKDELYHLMKLCWNPPLQRPTASQLQLILDNLISSGKIPGKDVQIDSKRFSQDFERRWQNLKPNHILKKDNGNPEGDQINCNIIPSKLKNAKVVDSSLVESPLGLFMSTENVGQESPRFCLKSKGENHGSEFDEENNAEECNLEICKDVKSIMENSIGKSSEEERGKADFQLNVETRPPDILNPDQRLKNFEADVDSWLKGVEINNEEDENFVRNISEAIRDLDAALAMEKTSSSEEESGKSSHQNSPGKKDSKDNKESVVEFKLESDFPTSFNMNFNKSFELNSLQNSEQPQSLNFTDFVNGVEDSEDKFGLRNHNFEESLRENDSLVGGQSRNSSDTDDEIWRKRIERGEISEKVKEKSKSIANLMVLTHFDANDESDYDLEKPFEKSFNSRNSFSRKSGSLGKSSMSNFGSENDLTNAVLKNDFEESLKKLSNDHKEHGRFDSLGMILPTLAGRENVWENLLGNSSGDFTKDDDVFHVREPEAKRNESRSVFHSGTETEEIKEDIGNFLGEVASEKLQEDQWSRIDNKNKNKNLNIEKLEEDQPNSVDSKNNLENLNIEKEQEDQSGQIDSEKNLENSSTKKLQEDQSNRVDSENNLKNLNMGKLENQSNMEKSQEEESVRVDRKSNLENLNISKLEEDQSSRINSENNLENLIIKKVQEDQLNSLDIETKNKNLNVEKLQDLSSRVSRENNLKNLNMEKLEENQSNHVDTENNLKNINMEKLQEDQSNMEKLQDQLNRVDSENKNENLNVEKLQEYQPIRINSENNVENLYIEKLHDQSKDVDGENKNESLNMEKLEEDQLSHVDSKSNHENLNMEKPQEDQSNCDGSKNKLENLNMEKLEEDQLNHVDSKSYHENLNMEKPQEDQSNMGNSQEDQSNSEDSKNNLENLNMEKLVDPNQITSEGNNLIRNNSKCDNKYNSDRNSSRENSSHSKEGNSFEDVENSVEKENGNGETNSFLGEKAIENDESINSEHSNNSSRDFLIEEKKHAFRNSIPPHHAKNEESNMANFDVSGKTGFPSIPEISVTEAKEDLEIPEETFTTPETTKKPFKFVMKDSESIPEILITHEGNPETENPEVEEEEEEEESNLDDEVVRPFKFVLKENDLDEDEEFTKLEAERKLIKKELETSIFEKNPKGDDDDDNDGDGGEMVILGACEDYTLDFFKGLKTTSEDVNAEKKSFEGENNGPDVFGGFGEEKKDEGESNGFEISKPVQESIDEKNRGEQPKHFFESPEPEKKSNAHVICTVDIIKNFIESEKIYGEKMVDGVESDVSNMVTGLGNDEEYENFKLRTPDDERSSDSGFRDKGSLSESVEDACEGKYNLEDIEAELEDVYGKGTFGNSESEKENDDESKNSIRFDFEESKFYEDKSKNDEDFSDVEGEMEFWQNKDGSDYYPEISEFNPNCSSGWYLHPPDENSVVSVNRNVNEEIVNAIRNELRENLPVQTRSFNEFNENFYDVSMVEDARMDMTIHYASEFSIPPLSPILEESDFSSSETAGKWESIPSPGDSNPSIMRKNGTNLMESVKSIDTNTFAQYLDYMVENEGKDFVEEEPEVMMGGSGEKEKEKESPAFSIASNGDGEENLADVTIIDITNNCFSFLDRLESDFAMRNLVSRTKVDGDGSIANNAENESIAERSSNPEADVVSSEMANDREENLLETKEKSHIEKGEFEPAVDSDSGLKSKSDECCLVGSRVENPTIAESNAKVEKVEEDGPETGKTEEDRLGKTGSEIGSGNNDAGNEEGISEADRLASEEGKEDILENHFENEDAIFSPDMLSPDRERSLSEISRSSNGTRTGDALSEITMSSPDLVPDCFSTSGQETIQNNEEKIIETEMESPDYLATISNAPMTDSELFLLNERNFHSLTDSWESSKKSEPEKENDAETETNQNRTGNGKSNSVSFGNESYEMSTSFMGEDEDDEDGNADDGNGIQENSVGEKRKEGMENEGNEEKPRDGDHSGDWDSDGSVAEEEGEGDEEEEESSSSSSGEFIWKDGENVSKLKAVRASDSDLEKIVFKGSKVNGDFESGINSLKTEGNSEKEKDSSEKDDENDDNDSSTGSSASITDFVPSAWNSQAIPSRSALRNCYEEADRQREKKSVWFKKQKYHCVYEYPREPSDAEDSEMPFGQFNYDKNSCENSNNHFVFGVNTVEPFNKHFPYGISNVIDYSNYKNWEMETNGDEKHLENSIDGKEEEEVEEGRGKNGGKFPKERDFNFYNLNLFDYDFNNAGANGSEFFVSSSSRPFQGGSASQVLTGTNQINSMDAFGNVEEKKEAGEGESEDSRDFSTPDSGLEDSRNVSPLEKKAIPNPEGILLEMEDLTESKEGVLDILDSLKFNFSPEIVEKEVRKSVDPCVNGPSSSLSPKGLGELRHARDKLKLDLPFNHNAELGAMMNKKKINKIH